MEEIQKVILELLKPKQTHITKYDAATNIVKIYVPEVKFSRKYKQIKVCNSMLFMNIMHR